MAESYKEKYVCRLSQTLQDQALRELNEDPDRREDDIEAIRQWMIKQPHINGRTDDAFILRYLRNCKFSLERTKEKIDNYYTLKSALPEWFANRDPTRADMQELLKTGVTVPLGYDQFGRKIFIGNMRNFDFDKFTVNDMMRLNQLMSDYILSDEQSQICGSVIINDLEGATSSVMMHFTPSVAKKMMHCWQNCIPSRLKAFHYLHNSPIFDTFFAIGKMFMKEKLLRRIYFHGSNLDSLHSHIFPEYLPTEYGGTAGDLQYFIDKFATDVLSIREYILEDEKYFVDEARRPGKPKTQEDLFGIDGSFRKLNID